MLTSKSPPWCHTHGVYCLRFRLLEKTLLWKEIFLGGRWNGRCWSTVSTAEPQGLSSLSMEKLTTKSMDPKDNYKDVAISEESWNVWRCSGLCSTVSFEISYLETPWPASLVLSIRRVSSKCFLNLVALSDLLLSRQPHHINSFLKKLERPKGWLPRKKRELVTLEPVSRGHGTGLATPSCHLSELDLHLQTEVIL